MSLFIHQLKHWPHFSWNNQEITKVLAAVRYRQGKLLGKMETLGFSLQEEATLQTLTLEVLKSSEIEGELLDKEQVRSSIARRLGIEAAGLVESDRNVEGVVEMMIDATQNYSGDINDERLFGWHASLFPTGRSGMQKINAGTWRDNKEDDPMQVVSGPLNRQTVHFEAPASELLPDEMAKFFQWFNNDQSIDAVLKAAVAHLWFVTVHPFDDGNGRIARALTDMQLARADGTSMRFYSMSAQVRKERNTYYNILEQTQKGSLDITPWLEWFLNCLDRALTATGDTLNKVLIKAKFWDQNGTTTINERQRLLINKMLDGFDGKLNTSKWAKIAKCSTDTALRDIQDLIKKNILMQNEAGGRSTGYLLNIRTVE